MNNAAMNLDIKYLLKSLLSILMGMYLKVELLGNVMITYFICQGGSILFSIAAAPFYIPINNALGFQKEFQFLHIFNIFCLFVFFGLVLLCLLCLIVTLMVMSDISL